MQSQSVDVRPDCLAVRLNWICTTGPFDGVAKLNPTYRFVFRRVLLLYCSSLLVGLGSVVDSGFSNVISYILRLKLLLGQYRR